MYLDKLKTQSFKIISSGVCFVFICSIIFPASAFASRSDAGGGEVAEFDVGDLAVSAGISLGSMAIGSAINAGVSSFGAEAAATNAALSAGDFSYVGMSSSSPSFLSAMGDSFAKSFNVNNMFSGLSTFSATSQVGRAVGSAGQYYGWNPSSTFLVSNIASAATGGFLNPSVAFGDSIPTDISLATESARTAYYYSLPTMAKGALIGGITGLASGAAIVAVDGYRMDNKDLSAEQRRPGAAGQIAGMIAGVAAGNFSRALVNPPAANIKAGNQETVFIKQADLPRIAARSFALIASNSVDKDNKFFTPSTVSSLVEGATLPMFRSMMPGSTTSFSLSDISFGLVEGVTHGSASYLISKASRNDPSFARALTGYGATLITGAVRGAIGHWMYNDSVKDAIDNEIKGPAPAKAEDRIAQEARKKELEEYKGSMASLERAVLTSMGKANTEFLDRTLAFGIPRGRPEKIDSLAMVDYFNKLNTYATAGQRPDWFASGLTSSMTSASAFAASNAFVTTLGNFNNPFIKDTLNIAPFAFDARPVRGEPDRDRLGGRR